MGKIKKNKELIFNKIANKKLGKVKIPHGIILEFGDFEIVKKLFIDICEHDFNHIYITNTFIYELKKSIHKFTNSSLLSNIENGSVCIHTKEDTTLFKFSNNNKTQILNIKCCIFMGEDILTDIFEWNLHYNTSDNKIGIDHVKGVCSDENKVQFEIIMSKLCILLFMKFAKIESKIIEPKSKVKFLDDKYINETNKPITIINCTWFTNITRTEGFNVSGHFRLQPVKQNGKWTRELIWINEYEKSGYTLKAKKNENTTGAN